MATLNELNFFLFDNDSMLVAGKGPARPICPSETEVGNLTQEGNCC